jgi:hypothetical protein
MMEDCLLDGRPYDLMTPIQPVTAVIDRSYRLATVNAGDSEIVLTDVPVGENLYSLLYQINATLAKSHQPFVVWRLEWVAGEADRLWLDQVPSDQERTRGSLCHRLRPRRSRQPDLPGNGWTQDRVGFDPGNGTIQAT